MVVEVLVKWSEFVEVFASTNKSFKFFVYYRDDLMYFGLTKFQ